jgi:hypothetical protein
MNTGIGDAVNLAWKLADVLGERAGASLLDSYEPERVAFARRLVATTDRAFTIITSRGPLPRRIRVSLVPRLFPILASFGAVRRLMFRTISQIQVNYRGGPLSLGRAGRVHAGDRLPWVEAVDNFAPLASLDWQVHVYGEPTSELAATCQARGLALNVFAWRTDMDRTALGRNAVYLVRPDGYVALADPNARTVTLQTYLDERRLLQDATLRPVDERPSSYS